VCVCVKHSFKTNEGDVMISYIVSPYSLRKKTSIDPSTSMYHNHKSTCTVMILFYLYNMYITIDSLSPEESILPYIPSL
jgi:hypothetical protein